MSMKKWITFILVSVCVLNLAACGSAAGDGEDGIRRVIGNSARYDETEIEEAFRVVEEVFEETLPGCTLTELRYDAEVEERFEEEMAAYEAERGQELIIVLSDFRTDENGGDGSLESNAAYTDWQWYLVRDGDADWEVLDWGY